jgi:PIN domain nuclease of toxin-antitoxin system
MVIKQSVNRMKLEINYEMMLSKIKSSEFEILQIEERYLETYLELPFLHRDPFDRILVATALTDDLIILSADEDIHKYDVNWIWE